MLEDNKIIYENIDVASNKAAREEIVNKTGQIAVPVVEIDGELAVGFDRKWIEEKLGIGETKKDVSDV